MRIKYKTMTGFAHFLAHKMCQSIVTIISTEPWDPFSWHHFLQNNPINVENVGCFVELRLSRIYNDTLT